MVLNTSMCLAMIKTAVLKTVVLPKPLGFFFSVEKRAPHLFLGHKTEVLVNYGIACPGSRKL
jgi:hypothetical protein